MKTILLIHGPNLNMLGKRDENHYGKLTLDALEEMVMDHALDFNVHAFQSNHEGHLIDFIQETEGDAIILNAGALTHSSYALHDALVDKAVPCVEVHLSDVENREDWRKISLTAPACIAKISGKGPDGYLEALELLKEKL
jgi:3-dehydroquinate dehydratase-2